MQPSKDLPEMRFGRIRIQIDRARCIGSGNCVKVAPSVFELDEEAVCAFRPDAASDDEERLLEACEVCPVDALIATREGG